jgi:outer membrane protein assembly factor BamD
MRSLAIIASLFLASLLAGCGLFPDAKDETIGWSANKLYAEAKDALNDGSYDKAIKYFEKARIALSLRPLRAAGADRIAYAYWKDQEPASAIAACDRFIKLHPNHPECRLRLLPEGSDQLQRDLGLLGYRQQPGHHRTRPQGRPASPSTPSRAGRQASRKQIHTRCAPRA